MRVELYSLVAIVVLFGANVNGNTICDDISLNENLCYASDDPHFKTFDGLSYDFHGTNTYKYLTSCTEGDYSTTSGLPFQVSVKHRLCWPGFIAACLDTVYIKLENGNQVTIPISTGIATPSSSPVTLANSGYYLTIGPNPRNPSVPATRFVGKWTDPPTGSVATITVDVARGRVNPRTDPIVKIWLSKCILEDAKRVCGLCGQADFTESNDYHIVEDGDIVTVGDAYTFGNFWCDSDESQTCEDPGSQVSEQDVFVVNEECAEFSEECCDLIWAEYCQEACQDQDDILNFDTWMQWCMFDGCAAVNNEVPDGVDCNLAIDEYFGNPIALCMTVCDSE